LVANVMVSIAAVPTLGRPNFPQRSGYFPSGVQLDLLPFGERALRHFLYTQPAVRQPVEVGRVS
jgi:hypothetical protein